MEWSNDLIHDGSKSVDQDFGNDFVGDIIETNRSIMGNIVRTFSFRNKGDHGFVEFFKKMT